MNLIGPGQKLTDHTRESIAREASGLGFPWVSRFIPSLTLNQMSPTMRHRS